MLWDGAKAHSTLRKILDFKKVYATSVNHKYNYTANNFISKLITLLTFEI